MCFYDFVVIILQEFFVQCIAMYILYVCICISILIICLLTTLKGGMLLLYPFLRDRSWHSCSSDSSLQSDFWSHLFKILMHCPSLHVNWSYKCYWITLLEFFKDDPNREPKSLVHKSQIQIVDQEFSLWLFESHISSANKVFCIPLKYWTSSSSLKCQALQWN